MSYPKIVTGKSMTSYLQDTALSASALKNFQRSPLHYWQALNGSCAIDSAALSKGTALHALMEGEDVFRNQYVVSPKFDKRTKAGKEGFAAFQVEHGAKDILSPDEMDCLLAMRDSMMAIPAIRAWVESFSIDREVSIFWKHASGIKCKARADLWEIGEGVVLDYKTCQDASPDAFERAIRHWGYDLSAVHYYEGTNCSRYGWICVESKPPYAACLHWLEPGDRFYQLQGYRHSLIEKLLECQAANEWPSYGKDGENLIRV